MNGVTIHDAMAYRVGKAPGYLAALDQSGGSTPKALAAYGIPLEAYHDAETMFRLMHEMRTRIITSSAFDHEQIIGAILFDRTMDGTVHGRPVPQYLWEERGIVPFVKIDHGLEDEQDGVRLMRPITGLDDLLDRARRLGVYGTKARSVLRLACPEGVRALVYQQVLLAQKVLDHGLVPILEPEVLVASHQKEDVEHLLLNDLTKALDSLSGQKPVLLKLTLPERENHYAPLVSHARVQRVVALSGGYTLDEACEKLKKNKGIIASFSRVLLDRLRVHQSRDAFDAQLLDVSQRIYDASVNKL